MEQLIDELLIAYGLDPASMAVRPMGKGHIHDTYLVEHSNDPGPPLMLQKMNNYVFRDIPVLMRNMELVSEHIAFKNRRAGKDPARNGILLLEAEGGKSYIGNDGSGYWRMFWFIEDQKTYEIAENEKIAFEGGKGIAHFQAMLTDLDPDKIGDTIPEFHHLDARVKQLRQAIENAPGDRLDKAGPMIELAEKHLPPVVALYEASGQGDVPVRITHNDTKFNNILFGNDDTVTCLIDLDTVMKGYAWFDFADALRTCASGASEEETDTGRVVFNIDIFRAFAKGYLSEAHTFLTEGEKALLHLAPPAFTYLQAIRFLADYLNGDVYYKTTRKDQNLARTENQFTLMRSILDQQAEMQQIITALLAELQQ
jgi:Ser/Thr protein kinase RdoA (MazF antagonist)